MKFKKICVSGIISFALLLCIGSVLASPGKLYTQSDNPRVKKIKKQILTQRQRFKKIAGQVKRSRMSGHMVSERKKNTGFDVRDFKRKIKKNTGNTRLFINASENINSLSDKLKSYGVRIIKTWDNVAAVELPIKNLEKIFNEVKSIKDARLPLKFYPQAVESEGVVTTESYDFHDTGFYGSGVKVAVIDVGFKGLNEAQQNGDLPYNVVTSDFSGYGLETEYYHGTACAEIVYDMAPQAELYLLKISTNIDIIDALNFCINNSIDIITFSIGTFGTGPGDGTGPLDEAFDVVRENNILAVAAVGNNGNTDVGGMTVGAHWKGVFRDNNDDNYHEFLSEGDEIDFNVFAAYPDTNDDGDPETNEVSVLLRWNDWFTPDTDYDLILYEYDPATDEVEEIAFSAYPQNGSSGQEPVEYISVDIPDDEDYLHYYAVTIVKEDDAQNIEMELYLGGTSMFIPYDDGTEPIASSVSSITEPADAESVLAVGVIDYINWDTGPQEDFSSQGPTNAWAGSTSRVKPDVMGPDGVTTFTYGYESFFGSSAATPHVAGLAALILSKYPGMNPDELQEAIESNAIDMGQSGKDNIYGWGRIRAVTDIAVNVITPVNSSGSSESGGGGGCFIDTSASCSLKKLLPGFLFKTRK